MKYVFVPLAGLIILVLNLLAPILVLFAIPFIRWDSAPSTHPARTAGEPVTAIWGDLPWWLSWFQTPDQRLPGDLNIPEVKAMFDHRGKWFTSYIWMGIRNPLMGLAAWLGKPAIGYAPYGIPGLWERPEDGVWRYTLRIGKVDIIGGYNVYALIDGTFRAAPVFTVKLVKTS